MAWATWSFQRVLAWKLMGIPHSAHFFSGGSSPAVFNSFMLFSPSFFLSLSLFSCSLLPPLKWFGVPRLWKGQRRADLLSRVTQCCCHRLYRDTTCPFCSVSTLRVWLYSHLRLSPPLPPPSLLYCCSDTEMRRSKCTYPGLCPHRGAGPMQDPYCLTTSTQNKSRNPAAASPTLSSHSTLQRLFPPAV